MSLWKHNRGYPSIMKRCYYYPLGSSSKLHLGLFAVMTTSTKDSKQAKTSDTDHSFYVIFYLETKTVYYCDAAECKLHSYKAKKLHIYAFMADVTWVKWPNPPPLRRWKVLIQCEKKDKTGKKVDMLNPTGNPRLCRVILTRERSALTATQMVV